MIKYNLRKAVIQDLDLSFEIRKNAMYKYIAESKGWDEEYEIKNHIADFSADVMRIIEVDGKPAGVIESVIVDGNIHVHGIYILEEFQNLKIGSRVMNEIFLFADAEKKPILLQVLKVNIKAKEFYIRLGFEISGENENYYTMIYKPVE